jgi:SAM-dependent methyltransferase
MQLIRRGLGRLSRGLGLTAPAAQPTSREEPAGWYDQLYAGTAEYHKSYEQSFYYFLWSVIVDRIRLAKLRRILEIGCGPGQLAGYLLEQGVEKYTGLDFSPQAIAMARQSVPAGEFVVGDARSPEIHARTEHDAIICTEVLEHIEDDLVVVSRFLPGKRCFCSVPNFPYDSHVRHFRDSAEVVDRYGRFFTALDVCTFKSPREPADRFFLFDGIRNHETAIPERPRA